jgi:hypothetical protein
MSWSDSSLYFTSVAVTRYDCRSTGSRVVLSAGSAGAGKTFNARTVDRLATSLTIEAAGSVSVFTAHRSTPQTPRLVRRVASHFKEAERQDFPFKTLLDVHWRGAGAITNDCSKTTS